MISLEDTYTDFTSRIKPGMLLLFQNWEFKEHMGNRAFFTSITSAHDSALYFTLQHGKSHWELFGKVHLFVLEPTFYGTTKICNCLIDNSKWSFPERNPVFEVDTGVGEMKVTYSIV